jgi:RES domain-containing protein
MIQAWRIVSERWAARAFDGEGARRYGGRWNSPGRATIYLAGSRALAALETLVHMSPRVAAQQTFIRFKVSISTKLISQVDSSELTFSTFVSPDSQEMGDQWLEHGTGPALSVPSAVIPEETNYLSLKDELSVHAAAASVDFPVSFWAMID